jgi:hypothetical protein
MSCGWPSVEGGIEVSVEVRSDLSDLEEHPACRSLVSLGRLSVPDLLSFLHYSAVGTSGGSYAPPRSHRGLNSFVIPQEYVACRFE